MVGTTPVAVTPYRKFRKLRASIEVAFFVALGAKPLRVRVVVPEGLVVESTAEEGSDELRSFT
jgi:hypothetical protein